MKSIITLSLGLLFTLICAGCSQKEYTPVKNGVGDKEYGYVFKETTGLTNYALIEGKEIAIQFRSDSDPQAVASFLKLGADILYMTDGKNVVLTGKLHPKILMTRGGPGRPDSQPYQELTLRGWRINST